MPGSELAADQSRSAEVIKNPVVAGNLEKLAPKKANAALPAQVGKFVNVPILMYHHVGGLLADSDALRRDLTVSTDDFKQEVEWIKRQGYSSVTLGQLYLASEGKFDLPKKAIVFTFDDGYTDVFENAVPVLLQNGFTGSFAVVTQFPGTVNGTNSYATWQQITDAHKKGMEIVSHTQNHFDGTSSKYNSDFIFKNLSGARKDLLDHGIGTNILIYPYGHYNLTYLEEARKAGYVLGLTVHFGLRPDLNNLLEIPRVRVHGGENLQRFQDILLGRKPVKQLPQTPNPSQTRGQ